MRKTLLKILPWFALVALSIFVVLIITFSTQRANSLSESEITHQAALSALEQIQAVPSKSINDPQLLEQMDAVMQKPYIATLWLFAADGKIIYSLGSTAMQGTIEQHSSIQVERALQALPDGTLNPQQRLALLAADAIQSEGEHNDIYNHLVAPVYDTNDNWIGYIGIAYDVNPGISALPDVGYMLAIIAIIISLGIYWISLPVWVFLDARQRSERAWIWTAFVLVGNLVALFAYLLVRNDKRGQIQQVSTGDLQHNEVDKVR
jgi:hypothetical protein